MNGPLSADLPGINRYAVVLEPTKAYVDWAGNCPDSDSDADSLESDEEGTVYLIPEVEGRFESWLKRNYKQMFEHELWSWCTDEAYWPKDRSFKAFQKFFRIRFHSVLLDLAKGPIFQDH